MWAIIELAPNMNNPAPRGKPHPSTCANAKKRVALIQMDAFVDGKFS
ncbi:hypothetical protein M2103_000890 [Ereboglobus sp. PH5-5]|nr:MULTISPECIES: hypothetical protein [unclassified Ereboglobus]MDF9826486.1 hypothetical protein [Ereboglobus sp. PH5-10]MDF9832676.1 hypothetical protein [Ereboglobus sp. PH5-5]